ncbi:MAG: chorismate mutase [Tissierellia bacterium]|nr:chorismate mutase [Tissierellia bacterium]
MRLVSIRGAITVDSNDKESIIQGTKELIATIEKENNIIQENVISIFFSATKDLDAEYPAKAARMLGYTQCGLMCFNEMYVEGSINKCIRLMILYQDSNLEQNQVKHVYLKGAKELRPDLMCK